MKADEDVKMVSNDACVVFSKACEMLIMEMTMRPWLHTKENKRKTLQMRDVATAISRANMFGFLVDIVPSDDKYDRKVFASIPSGGSAPIVNVNAPYYNVPHQSVTEPLRGAPRVIRDRHVPDQIHNG